jgi:asparagine synthase (glutamine-hydrolysing)
MTVINGVRRLPNGHVLKYDLDQRTVEERPYWTALPHSHGDWLAILEEAVRLRTVADRPLGLFLSGGIDSSVIASCLARSGEHALQSFTAAFPDSHFDESEDAAQVAATLGIANTAIPITMSVRDDFNEIVASLDEPYADPSSIPTWYLARETARSVKVVLSGDGGDELFAGYKRVDRHLKSAWRRALRIPGMPIIPTLEPRGAGKWVAEAALPWRSAYMLRFSGFTPGQRRFLTGDAPLMRMEYWRGMSEDNVQLTPAHDAIDDLLAIDRANYLPEYILRKADLCTMAHGLELRAPLLDHVFTETVLALPHAERYTKPRKVLLKRAMPKLAPLHLFSRKKRGFNPPLEQWLTHDLAERMPELPARLAQRTEGWLSAARIRAFVDRYRAGGGHLSEQMLQLLMLDESLSQLDALSREHKALNRCASPASLR